LPSLASCCEAHSPRLRGHGASTGNKRKDIVTGKEFKVALRKIGLSGYAAAPFLGLSRRTVYRIAAGEYPAPLAAEKLLKLAIRLRLSATDIDEKIK
jgi:hypothetical protein